MHPDSISKTFTQRTLSEDQASIMQEVNLRFSQIEEKLNEIPASRLRSLALTELEKTSLVVNKAISRMNDPA